MRGFGRPRSSSSVVPCLMAYPLIVSVATAAMFHYSSSSSPPLFGLAAPHPRETGTQQDKPARLPDAETEWLPEVLLWLKVRCHAMH